MPDDLAAAREQLTRQIQLNDERDINDASVIRKLENKLLAAERERRAPIIAVTAVIQRDGKFLTIKRSEHEVAFPGLWAFPGGKAEGNETLEQTLTREVLEEVGLKVIGHPEFLDIFRFTRPDLRPVLGCCFAAQAVGDVRLSSDFTEYRWATAGEFAGLLHIPGIERDLELALKKVIERTNLIANLIVAERERCAKVAEDFVMEHTWKTKELCEDIAQKIRSGQ